MIKFKPGLADGASGVELNDAHRPYAMLRDLVGTGGGSDVAGDRCDAIIGRLYAKYLNAPNPFAVSTPELADLASVDVTYGAAFSTDTPPATPSGPLAAEIAVTDLRAPGAPSHTLLAHRRAPVAA